MDVSAPEGLASLVAAAVASSGLYCESVVMAGQGGTRKLTVVVDLPEDQLGGVDLDALTAATQRVSEALDSVDDIDGRYQLEVTTPGVGRPLTEPRHFKRARGRLVTLRLTDGGEETGRIRAVSHDTVFLVQDEGEVAIRLAEIERGTVEIEFRPPPAEFLADLGPLATNGHTPGDGE